MSAGSDQLGRGGAISNIEIADHDLVVRIYAVAVFFTPTKVEHNREKTLNYTKTYQTTVEAYCIIIPR